ncbi:hypothetical protein Dimus_005202 [Dionaea muscipula]
MAMHGEERDCRAWGFLFFSDKLASTELPSSSSGVVRLVAGEYPPLWRAAELGLDWSLPRRALEFPRASSDIEGKRSMRAVISMRASTGLHVSEQRIPLHVGGQRLASSFMEWRPASTGPRWRAASVGGWRATSGALPRLQAVERGGGRAPRSLVASSGREPASSGRASFLLRGGQWPRHPPP